MTPEEMEQEHPKNRPIEPEDPMVLNGNQVAGDPWIMLDGLIEEYARMGWSGKMIEELFDQPFYQATHGLKLALGEEAVRSHIRRTLSRCGVFRVQATFAPESCVPHLLTPGESAVTPDGCRVPARPEEVDERSPEEGNIDG